MSKDEKKKEIKKLLTCYARKSLEVKKAWHGEIDCSRSHLVVGNGTVNEWEEMMHEEKMDS